MFHIHRTKLRGAVIGACTASLLVGAGLATLPAQAQDRGTAAAAARTLRSSRPDMQVATFYQEYLDAVNGIQHEGKNTYAIREEYLSKELDEALTVWGSEHQVDPVVRRNEMPKTWSTTESDSTETHTKIIVTERWEDGTQQDVWYQVRLSDLVIDSLTDPTT
ncbi:hypothetical protein ACFWA9_07785 [Kitasatospora sp. NPDC059973]|uniref:hypothetical protein n=1 Tax=Kitasatospora sp. NPDC059973 TaxID=3347020 RepID=UPI0036C285D4